MTFELDEVIVGLARATLSASTAERVASYTGNYDEVTDAHLEHQAELLERIYSHWLSNSRRDGLMDVSHLTVQQRNELD